MGRKANSDRQDRLDQQDRSVHKAFADRLEREKGHEPIDWAYRLALGRPATPEEKAQAARFMTEQMRRISGKSEGETRRAALVDFCHVLLNTNEFLYVD